MRFAMCLQKREWPTTINLGFKNLLLNNGESVFFQTLTIFYSQKCCFYPSKIRRVILKITGDIRGFVSDENARNTNAR